MQYHIIDWSTVFEAAPLLGISPVVLAGLIVSYLASAAPAPQPA